MKRNSTALAALLASALIATPTMAASRAEISPSLVSFRVDSQHQSSTLRVSGSSYSFEQTFTADETPAFALSQHGLADGTYAYELVVNPVATKDGEDRGEQKEREATFGYFTVAGGALVDPELAETEIAGATIESNIRDIQGVASAAQVYATDLIVQGSECVGSDCSPDEPFKSDTLRLKDQNLRIKFEDTSGNGSFPSNDWMLVANDSSNGGANRFSIEDASHDKVPFTVEANATNNALYIDDGGRIGFGTGTPLVKLPLTQGYTPTLRLEQDGSSGFTAQTWDIAGNETNFFVRDVTGGSKLPLRIKPGAPDDSLFVAASGNVGFGSDSPTGAIELKRSSGAVDLDFTASSNSWRIRAHKSNGQFNFIDNSANATPFRLLPGANNTLLVVGGDESQTAVNDQVTVNGNLAVTGGLTITGTCSGCDAVFTPEFELETIEEHAAFMWQNSFLPGVGETPEGKTSINVFSKTTGILQELEKAHIYIEQLNNHVGNLNGELESKDAQMADLTARLERMEQQIANQ